MQEQFQEFIHNLGKLKRKDRTGWVNAGINKPESVAEHCFRTGMMAYIIAPKFGLNADKCLKMGLFHDVGEYEVPDYTPHDNIPKAEKRKQEEAAMRKLCEKLENGSEILGLWLEYEDQHTPEAKFVKAVDTLEMYNQATEYAQEQPEIDLEQFWQNSQNYDFGVLKDMFEELKKKKEDK